jgi:Ca2+-binding EF-hand superfamily protein
VTSVSALGSTLTQYQAPLNPLDKNGDGVVSADELAAASQSSTASASTASTSAGDDDSSGSDVVQKIAADILALMLSLQKTDDSDSQSGTDAKGDGSKGALSALDTNGDGKLTTSEILAADPQKIAADGSDDDDSGLMAKVLTDMQTALRAYQTTYGASPVATGDSDQTA